MRVSRHTEVQLIALTDIMPVPASVVIDRLRHMEAPINSVALEVAQMTMSYGSRSSSNGDTVVVVVRDGQAVTAMLRRSWNQPFTPDALKVDEVVRWQWSAEQKEWAA